MYSIMEIKHAFTWPTDYVQKTISADANTRPAEIHSYPILSDLCSKESWEKWKKTVKKVISIRNISNRKSKQKRLCKQKNKEVKKQYRS